MRVFTTIASGSVFGNQGEVQLLRDANGFVYYAIPPPFPFLPGGRRQRAEIAAWCTIDEAIARLRRAGSLSASQAQVEAALTAIQRDYSAAGLPRPGIAVAVAVYSAGYPTEEAWLAEIRSEAATRRAAGKTDRDDTYLEGSSIIERIVAGRGRVVVGAPGNEDAV